MLILGGASGPKNAIASILKSLECRIKALAFLFRSLRKGDGNLDRMEPIDLVKIKP